MSGHDVATLGAAPASQDVRRRWVMLAAALVVGLVVAFAVGSAIKKTSAPAPTGSLAPSSSVSGQHASITALTNAGAVPALHAPPAKPKTKAKTTTTGTGSQSSGSSSVGSSSVSTTPVQSTGSTQSSAPTNSSTPTQSSGTGGSSSSSGTTGGGSGGGGSGGGGGAG